jgi:hypothetical protein
MKKYIMLGVLAAIAFTGNVVAGTDYKTSKNVVEDTCLYRNSEFQVDTFATGAFYKNGRPGWGGGLGLNYFLFRYIGLGIEQDLIGRDDNGSNAYAEWGTIGNVFLRYPICSLNLAPYVMVGGGAFYGTSKTTGVGHVGGGLEYRFNNNIGVFTDARWLFTGNGNNDDNGALLGRAGLRFSF